MTKTTETLNSDLITGQVMHRRLDGLRYRFTYRLFWLRVDIDELAELDRRLAFFSYNRFNFMSFQDKDHGNGTPGALRIWVEELLARQGVELAHGRITLLCMPRVLGFVFNPISVWYCRHRDGSLRAILCEVNNTFGEKHCYCLHRDGAPMDWPVRASKPKVLHVSPFMDMDSSYRFRVSEPSRKVALAIRQYHGNRPILEAALTGQRQPFSDHRILKLLLLYPMLTVKVVAAIHWEALKIWSRGGRVFRKPPPPAREAS